MENRTKDKPDPPQQKMAYTVKSFCAAYDITTRKFYDEVNSGRLRIRKMGKRTLVARIDADAWLDALPVVGK